MTDSREHFIEITAQEALDLLRKWYEEERTITCSITATADNKPFQVGYTTGAIKTISSNSVIIGGIWGTPEMKAATHVEIPLSHASYKFVEPEAEAGLDHDIMEALADVGVDRHIDSCLRVGLERSCIVYDLWVLPEGL